MSSELSDMYRWNGEKESNGKKVIVVTSENFYSLSPIKVLQPNEKLDPVNKAPSFCNRIVFTSKGKENGTSMLGCETCKFNRPSSSSHYCIDTTEEREKPRKVNILKRGVNPKTPSAPRSDGNFTTELLHGLVKKSTETGKVQKKKYVRKSKGPKSTSSLLNDMPLMPNFQIDLTANAKNFTPTPSKGANLAKFELRHGVLEQTDQPPKTQKRIYIKKCENPKKAPKAVENPNPRKNFIFIDLTALPDSVSSTPAVPTQTSKGSVKYNGNLETSVMDLLNKQYGNALERQFFIKNDFNDGHATTLKPTNTIFDLTVNQPDDKYEIPVDINQYKIKEEQLVDQLEQIHDVKAVNAESYTKYFGSYSLLDSPEDNKLFTADELKIVPDKIFDSPVKVKEQNLSPEEKNCGDVSPNDFLKNPNFNLSKMILEDPHNSVEIKREIINNSDLLDEDILEIFTVPSVDTFDIQSYITDPRICITFEDLKHPTNQVLAEEKCGNAPEIINSEYVKSGISNESAKSSDIRKPQNEDIPQNTDKPSIVSSSTAPPGELKFYDVTPESIGFNIQLNQASLEEETISLNNKSPLTELLDIVFKDLGLEEPIKNASEVVKLLEKDAEVCKPANNISKESNDFMESLETTANNLSRKSANSFVTEIINSGMELSICSKSDEITTETCSESSSFGNNSKSFSTTVSVQTEDSFLSEPPKYFDSFKHTDEGMPDSKINKSTKGTDDALEKILQEDIATFLSKTKEKVSVSAESILETNAHASASPESILETNAHASVSAEGILEPKTHATFEEATKTCILDRSVNTDVLEVIQCEHSYGRVSDSSEIPEVSEVATVVTSDDILTDIKTDVNNCDVLLKNENGYSEPITGAENDIISDKFISPVKNEIKEAHTNVVKDLPLDSHEATTSSSSKPTVMTDVEISILKTKIMEGTIDREEILEIIEGKNIQCSIANSKLDQQKCDIKHLSACLKKQVDVMRKTYDYFDDIIEAAMKDLDKNVTEANAQNILDNLHFVKDMVDKTFAYYDIGKRREKKVKYRVINITKKDIASAQKNAGVTIPVVGKAPQGTGSNIARKTVTKTSNKLLTRTLYRMNKLLDALEKRKGLMRTRKQNGFVAKLKEIAQREDAERSNVEETEVGQQDDHLEEIAENECKAESDSGERPNAETSQKQVDDTSATIQSSQAVKLEEKRAVLTSLENISNEDVNVVSKITPMNRDIKIILSQIDSINKLESIFSERNATEEMRSSLEKKPRKVSKLKVEGTAQDKFVTRDENKNILVSNKTTVASIDAKDFNKWTIDKKFSENDTSSKKRRGMPAELFNMSRYSQRSRKPPGFYSEMKMNSKESTPYKNTKPHKYKVDCTNLNLNVTRSKISHHIDLAYELKNDDKPCVILYNKKTDVKVPIFEKFTKRYERNRMAETSPTVLEQPLRRSVNNVNGKTDEPKTVNKVKATDETKTEPNQSGRVLRKTERVESLTRRSLRISTIKERNAARKPTKS